MPSSNKAELMLAAIYLRAESERLMCYAGLFSRSMATTDAGGDCMFRSTALAEVAADLERQAASAPTTEGAAHGCVMVSPLAP